MSFLRQIFRGKSKATTGNGGALLRLRSRVLNTPHAIDPAKLEVIASVLSDRIGVAELQMIPDDVEARAAAVSGGGERLESGPSVAVIDVHGTLVQRSGGLDALSGLTSYGSIRSQFDAAMADPSVSAIVLDIDSGGGEVAGLFDLVDHIASARGVKPVTAIVNEFAASAAYAIASAASRIVATRTSYVGSIGVIAMHVDQSAANEQDGLKVTHIKAGAHKADGTPHEPLSEGAQSDMQARVDALYDVFVATVAKNRGVPEQTVRDTEARIYLAADALALGLIDEVASADAAMAAILGGDESPVAPGDDEPEKLPVDKLPDDVDRDDVPSDDEVEPEAKAAPPTVESQIADALAAERKRVTEISAVCDAFGVPDLAMGLVAKGATIEQARSDALRLAAMNDTLTLSGVDPFAGAASSEHPLDAARRRRSTNK